MSLDKFFEFVAAARKDEPRWLTDARLRRWFDSVGADEIRMPSEGPYCDTVRRGWLELHAAHGGLFVGQSWKRRWAVLSGSVLYLLREPDAAEPLLIIPLRDLQAMAGAHWFCVL